MSVSNSSTDVIVIGAGVAGLMAVSELLKNNIKVTVLEASDRVGGRIHTLKDPSFSRPIERGVEFIHGDLPLTMELLKAASISYEPVNGKMYRLENGEWKSQEEFTVGWDELIKKMNEIGEDMTVDDFLEKYFNNNRYKELRDSVCRFAQGFDLADTSTASILELREEWMAEEDEQFRIEGGFDQLINYLHLDCKNSGAEFHLDTVARNVQWQKDDVSVISYGGKIFQSRKLLVTVPAGILKANREHPCSLLFEPQIDSHLEAVRHIGFGSVIKVLIEFSEPFWKKIKKDLGFVFSKEPIPTWWVQSHWENLLTGWAGGPQAKFLEDKSDEFILQSALQSLSHVFNIPFSELQSLVRASMVANWKNDLFTAGAYSFNMVGSRQAREALGTPVENTVFFAGEALYSGASPGTVEAALVSARFAAEKIVQSFA